MLMSVIHQQELTGTKRRNSEGYMLRKVPYNLLGSLRMTLGMPILHVTGDLRFRFGKPLKFEGR